MLCFKHYNYFMSMQQTSYSLQQYQRSLVYSQMEAAHKLFTHLHNNLIPLTAKTCLSEILKGSEFVSLKRTVHNNYTTVLPSTSPHFKYSFHDGVETLDGIPLHHKDIGCEGANALLQGTCLSRLCICVMVKSNDDFLCTQRSMNISFPGAWVLPGGGIQEGETILEAAVREVKQEVGLDIEIDTVDSFPMMWQSYYVVQDNIKRSSLVLFLESTNTLKKELSLQQSEVSLGEWRPLSLSKEDQVSYDFIAKRGFAQGHLRYLKHSRNKFLNKRAMGMEQT